MSGLVCAFCGCYCVCTTSEICLLWKLREGYTPLAFLLLLPSSESAGFEVAVLMISLAPAGFGYSPLYMTPLILCELLKLMSFLLLLRWS